jgi:aspartyl-tRNA(Asn)/glutamyl-tRNA(Gln) amidotransferase subunit C
MSQSIPPEQVRHIGLLARIQLSDEDVRKFSSQLGHILEAFDKIQALETQDVEPMVHPVPIENVLAQDTLAASLAPEEALANAPARDGDFFKVPKVLGDSQ